MAITRERTAYSVLLAVFVCVYALVPASFVKAVATGEWRWMLLGIPGVILWNRTKPRRR